MLYWNLLSKSKISNPDELLNTLLKNRGINTENDKKDFFAPIDPMKISLASLGIKKSEVEKAIKRIELAKKNKEHVIIYGDYDADGISGTATLWETLNRIGVFVLPHIPERFSEGYGLNIESVKKLKREDPSISLIITVDHGITAVDKVGEVKKMGIDMIISDHHQKGKVLPEPLSLIYTTKIGGSALAWFFAREISKNFGIPNFDVKERLQFAAIGTLADQIPLTGLNRSVVKYGLEELNKTKRPGLLALYKEAGITEIGPYEVGFIIAPRINSMGRLKHGLESLRLLCTTDKLRGLRLAGEIAKTNQERQKIVDEVVVHAMAGTGTNIPYVIVLANESYHEGVIGLAAAKLVEKFYRPAIVMSKGSDVSKASGRSIAGFNIIENIRKLESYYIEGGGHPMAAGFSIKTENIEIFTEKINKLAKDLLTEEILQKRIKIDCEIGFDLIDESLIKLMSLFEPTGIGNPQPNFLSKRVEIIDAKTIGREKKHLKLKLKQNEHIFDSIYFNGGEMYSKLEPGMKLDIVYGVEENIWNGYKSIQLKIKDIQSC